MSETSRQAVVTGGAGILARAIAGELAAHDYLVSSPSRNEMDVRSPKGVEAYFAGRAVDLLVCNAGITRDAPLARLSESAWDEVWESNYRGALASAESAIPSMVERGGGQVIFISSFSAIHPPSGQSAYASSKAALLGLVSDLSVRHGGSNIRVNAILPGFLETPMTEGVTDARRCQVLAQHTLGRLNTCEDVARFIRFLDQEMPHTSGQSFQLDSRLAQW